MCMSAVGSLANTGSCQAGRHFEGEQWERAKELS